MHCCRELAGGHTAAEPLNAHSLTSTQLSGGPVKPDRQAQMRLPTGGKEENMEASDFTNKCDQAQRIRQRGSGRV